MQENWRSLLPAIILGFVGLGLIGYGLVILLLPKEPEIEIIKASSPSPSSALATIVVDIAGAVERPGVYSLAAGSRISDALIAAGGLSVSADKNYLSRNINLATPVVDGSKIYILKKGESPILEAANSVGNTLGTTTNSLISINSASKSELDGLWGIGEARADDIINNRPYTSLEEIKTKANIPSSVYDKIKDKLSL